MDLTERVVDTRPIYDGKIVHLRVDTIEMPNGHRSQREIISHRGAVCVVPVTADGGILMVRQFRLAAGRVLLEIPAGTLEADEDPAACAGRELEEETGYKPGSLTRLFSAFLSPGYSTETVHAYLAHGLTAGEVHLDAGENVRTEVVSASEILPRIQSGDIEDAKTIAALMVARAVMDRAQE